MIRSSVLGGRVLAEFKDLTTYAENDPLKYSSKSYVYLKGVQLGFQMDAHKATGDKFVAWMYHNPTVGNYFAEYQLNNSSYQQVNFPYGEMTFDPLGSYVGISQPPQALDIPAPFTFVMGQFMEASTGKCYADYVETRCEVVQKFLNNGTGAHAPLDPYTTDSNNRLNQITFDWDNGFYGFVPVGARRSQSGRSWYDPYMQTEGTLRNKLLSFNFGAGFGLTDGQQGGKSTLTATGQSLVTDDAGRSCKQSEITPVFLWNKPTGIPLVETPHTFIQIPNRMTVGFYAAISVEHFAAVPGLFSLPATGGGAIASSIRVRLF
ncbi:MAG: hypothetical protein AB7F87_21405 [Oligoflexales bacterium]